jgi:GR25 family glycosyltransferase involved in LPS biosynthesis
MNIYKMDYISTLFILGVISLIIAVTILVVIIFTLNSHIRDFQACVINLPRRRDRLVEFGKHYTLPVKYEIIDAVDGRLLDVDELAKNNVIGNHGLQSLLNTEHGIPKHYHYELGTVGAIGCSLSHIKAWEKVVKENIKMMMVFEDDAWVIGMTLSDIQERINDIPEDWHLYMIGQPHTILEGIPVKEKTKLYKVTRFCGTHAYIVNLQGAQWLLSYGRLLPIEQQIDAHLSELASDHGLNIYIHLNKPFVSPFGGNSDIQVMSDKATFDRLQIV